LSLLGVFGCARSPEKSPPPPPPAPIGAEAGFVDIAPRDVVVHGSATHIGARARLFYNFVPAATDPESKPTFVLFNGFAAEIVRSFGTGPMTVADGGAVVENPSALTSTANLLYIEPRQAGFSYDVVDGGSPTLATNCSASVFNEYVDAAEVLLGVLDFLDAHPRLGGPVAWVGESYGGVRVQWIVSFLRNDWSVAPYDDPTLRARLDKLRAANGVERLLKAQILLEPWLLGKAHSDAILLACKDPDTVNAVASSIGTPCTLGDACGCAAGAERSPYNFTFSIPTQARRVYEANLAHVTVARIDALLGVPLERVAGLSAHDRGAGFKCDMPDDSVPPEDDLVKALGTLPSGQAYFVPFSPLEPSKEVATPADPDWRSQNFEASAFIDNLHDVPTFVTDGPLDLVVPTKALAPGLRTVMDPSRVDDSDPTRIRVSYPDGDRFIDVRRYPNAGHMITMLEADQFAKDVAAWLAP
jgi:hypothetical protein